MIVILMGSDSDTESLSSGTSSSKGFGFFGITSCYGFSTIAPITATVGKRTKSSTMTSSWHRLSSSSTRTTNKQHQYYYDSNVLLVLHSMDERINGEDAFSEDAASASGNYTDSIAATANTEDFDASAATLQYLENNSNGGGEDPTASIVTATPTVATTTTTELRAISNSYRKFQYGLLYVHNSFLKLYTPIIWYYIQFNIVYYALLVVGSAFFPNASLMLVRSLWFVLRNVSTAASLVYNLLGLPIYFMAMPILNLLVGGANGFSWDHTKYFQIMKKISRDREQFCLGILIVAIGPIVEEVLYRHFFCKIWNAIAGRIQRRQHPFGFCANDYDTDFEGNIRNNIDEFPHKENCEEDDPNHASDEGLEVHSEPLMLPIATGDSTDATANGVTELSTASSSSSSTSKKAIKWLGYAPWVLVSSVLFAAIHISNWNQPPDQHTIESIVERATKTLLKKEEHAMCPPWGWKLGQNLARVFLSSGNIPVVLSQCYATFFLSTRIFTPMYMKNGLLAAIGSHIAWNFSARTLGIQLILRLGWKIGKYIKERWVLQSRSMTTTATREEEDGDGICRS